MIAYTETEQWANNLAQFWCIYKEIIRISSNNDDEIELSFRSNENWIKFNSLSSCFFREWEREGKKEVVWQNWDSEEVIMWYEWEIRRMFMLHVMIMSINVAWNEGD